MKKFVIGGATASIQSEGKYGRGDTNWDVFLQEKGKFNADIASDFFHKYKEDIALMKEMKMEVIRISMELSRIFPEGIVDEKYISKEGLDYYHNLVDELLVNNITPFITLHHFGTPIDLHNKGDILNLEMIDTYVKYGKFLFKEFGSKVKNWISINEPNSYYNGMYIIGHFPSGEKSNISKAIQAAHNFALMHAKIEQEFRKIVKDGRFGIVLIAEGKYPASASLKDINAAKVADFLYNKINFDLYFQGKYDDYLLNYFQEKFGSPVIKEGDLEIISKAKIDFFGLNYYTRHIVSHYEGQGEINHNGTGEKGTSKFSLADLNFQYVQIKDAKYNDWDWEIFPQGLEDMIMRVTKEYGVKNIYITENGMGFKDIISSSGEIDDTPRIEYLQEHIDAIFNANKQGADVKGYFVWSLHDCLSWTNGYNKRYAPIYVDFKTQERKKKKSFFFFKKLIEKINQEQDN